MCGCVHGPGKRPSFQQTPLGVQPWKVNKDLWSHPQLWLVQPPWVRGGQDGVPQRADASSEPVGTPEDNENTPAFPWGPLGKKSCSFGQESLSKYC